MQLPTVVFLEQSSSEPNKTHEELGPCTDTMMMDVGDGTPARLCHVWRIPDVGRPCFIVEIDRAEGVQRNVRTDVADVARAMRARINDAAETMELAYRTYMGEDN